MQRHDGVRRSRDSLAEVSKSFAHKGQNSGSCPTRSWHCARTKRGMVEVDFCRGICIEFIGNDIVDEICSVWLALSWVKLAAAD